MVTSSTVHIDGYENLDHALTDLHDQRFDLDAMIFDAARRRWSARFFRRIYDPTRTTRERTGLLTVRDYFPVIECTLTLDNVTACRVLDKSHIVIYTFNQCERTAFGCTLRFCEDLAIDIEVEGGVIVGDLREREFDRRGYVQKWGPAESGIRLEGED